MGTETAAFVSTAAATMVSLLTTDAWTQVKREVTGLWRRFRPGHAAAVEDDLEAAREEAIAAADGDEAAAVALAAGLTTEWEARLRRLLAADPAAVPELERVVTLLASALERATDAPGEHPGNVTITQVANPSGRSSVIQVAGNARLDR